MQSSNAVNRRIDGDNWSSCCSILMWEFVSIRANSAQLAGKPCNLLHRAGILFQCAVNRQMVVCGNGGQALLIKLLTLLAVLTNPLQQSADSVEGKRCSRIINTDEGAVVMRRQAGTRNGWPDNP